MADNVNITSGAGTTIATDQCGTDHYQRIKLTDGTADSITPINTDVGAKVNALRIAPANDITDGTYIGDIKFGEAEPNSAAILSDTTAILSDTTSIASDTTAILADTASIASDATAMLADTAAIQTSVELLDNAVDGNFLNVNLNMAGTDAAAGEGIINAQTQRVTLATDDDGVAHLATIAGDTTSIDGKITACDTGAVVVASGAITAELSVTDNAVLDAIDTVLDLINAKLVTGTVIGDVNLGATDNAVLDTIETNTDSLTVVGGGTEATALRVTLANDSTGVVTVDGTVTADLSDNDNAVLDSIVTNTNREAITGYGQATLDHADVTTAQELVAAVADKKFYITSIVLSVSAAGTYWIEDEDGAQITCKYSLAAYGGVSWSCPIDTPFKSTTANKGLKVKGSAAGVIGCMITYYTLA